MKAIVADEEKPIEYGLIGREETISSLSLLIIFDGHTDSEGSLTREVRPKPGRSNANTGDLNMLERGFNTLSKENNEPPNPWRRITAGRATFCFSSHNVSSSFPSITLNFPSSTSSSGTLLSSSLSGTRALPFVSSALSREAVGNAS